MADIVNSTAKTAIQQFGPKMHLSPKEAVSMLLQQVENLRGASRYNLHNRWIFLSPIGYALTEMNDEWDDGTGGLRVRCPRDLSASALTRTIENPVQHRALVRALELMRSPFFSQRIRLDAADVVGDVLVAALRLEEATASGLDQAPQDRTNH